MDQITMSRRTTAAMKPQRTFVSVAISVWKCRMTGRSGRHGVRMEGRDPSAELDEIKSASIGRISLRPSCDRAAFNFSSSVFAYMRAKKRLLARTDLLPRQTASLRREFNFLLEHKAFAQVRFVYRSGCAIGRDCCQVGFNRKNLSET